jgi:receptor-binding and translocation channel-forming TcA subunit of Tc toxin
MEAEHLQLLGSTLALQHAQSGIDLFGNLVALVPNTFAGVPPGVTFGGDNLAQSLRAFSSYLGSMVSILGTTGSLAATMGGYARRADDWKLQRDLAEKELTQLDKQLVAAEIREAMTETELANHDRQLADARQVESFLKTKYTGEELFGWMSGQLAALHFQAYRLAYDVANRAQAALRVELGDDTATFVQFGHWDSLRKGLLAGDRLALDLRRMETAYLERNVREAELTRHVSLALLNPSELLRLRQDGTCVIDVPEALFDLDHPGHYLRRIKSVSVTVPSVTGPYAGIPAKLTLVKCSTRLSADVASGYQATPQRLPNARARTGPVDFPQRGAGRRRAFRGEPARRAVPPVRGPRRHQHLGA